MKLNIDKVYIDSDYHSVSVENGRLIFSDSKGRTLQIKDSFGNVWKNTYTQNRMLVYHKDPDGEVTYSLEYAAVKFSSKSPSHISQNVKTAIIDGVEYDLIPTDYK